MRLAECCGGLFLLFLVLFANARVHLYGQISLMYKPEERTPIFEGQRFMDRITARRYKPHVKKIYIFYYYFVIVAYIILSIATAFLYFSVCNELIVGVPLSIYGVVFFSTFRLEKPIKSWIYEIASSAFLMYLLLRNFRWS